MSIDIRSTHSVEQKARLEAMSMALRVRSRAARPKDCFRTDLFFWSLPFRFRPSHEEVLLICLWCGPFHTPLLSRVDESQ